ncbi:uncharacterized protein LOC106175450 [Lingula anatina]|uniref:Uncharacterized protein LOC106175450 n=1 Tax=Lingula anatina TaxID=7574 RepID=A0A1S3JS39_LINAN|nr:uncharacterized protein LOC106175450 [Lingula anatina]XP_013412916.1 uncharacterized protein LOC106175450 [Lingula anatina]XP_013412917.1 uncharacterized protein LOC106175450 [Lingula anatina]XP_013412918.1 uncharacterized protein LOC106175450 [Lingula anatina]XP_013412919.1 uncharacterized protein LOC106175450 [Lingula anatina]XP_013412920.1 uncharacterized protein LOC106175450 [Lingula anatina]XP_013412921.1 uncharacterized protein LOC106175450 [Lingula anatina]XP_013412922.1 uncharacte|eukprot:XP_013412915.1 uncharacterized protein LOC106175450 [Lingula anatina]
MAMNKWAGAVLAVIILVVCISMIIFRPVCEMKLGLLSKHLSDSIKERPYNNSLTSEFIKRLGTGNINAVNENLLEHLRGKWILPPSKLSYNLSKPKTTYWDQMGQSKLVDKILKQRRKGFFVESGAYDGEGHSNSLFFEISRDWKGLLVEPNPWSFEVLLNKNRKTYAVNSCLATGSSPAKVDFTFAQEIGGIPKHSHVIPKREQNLIQGKSRIQCFPIRSLLAAIGRNHVDYFTLDVEGAEIEILKSFPWQHVTVDVWTIEYAVHGGGPNTPKREKAIREIFKNTGLYREGTILGGQDIVFVRNDVPQ